MCIDAFKCSAVNIGLTSLHVYRLLHVHVCTVNIMVHILHMLAVDVYCALQVVKELAKAEGRFRVLALSATPGNDLKVFNYTCTALTIQILCIVPCTAVYT